MATANSLGNNLVVLYGGEQGPFTDGSVISVGIPVAVAAADLDGDGDLDLVSASASPGTLEFVIQTAPRVFEFSATLNVVDPRDVTVADLDGDLDLISPQGGANSVPVFFQIAPGRFNQDADKLTTNTEMSEPVVVLAADIDGDGKPDLVSANDLTNNLNIFYRGTGAISCVLSDVHL